jgi:outer membrane lipoprotein
MKYRTYMTLAVIPLLFLVGCDRPDVIPERLEGKVDRDLRYVQVKDNPEMYRGKLMLVGGKVLSATRLKEGTRIEVLQIPLSSDLIPDENPEASKGRFVAMDLAQNVVDPAILDDSRHITLVGEVVGSTMVKIDEIEKRVPQLNVKHITVWDRDNLRAYYPYHGYNAPYGWGYRGYYGYPYYW